MGKLNKYILIHLIFRINPRRQENMEMERNMEKGENGNVSPDFKTNFLNDLLSGFAGYKNTSENITPISHFQQEESPFTR
jgi:hypothetical protein